MRILCSLAAIALAGIVLPGCGESEVKRSVDAQIEALRFYEAETPMIALIETSGETGISDAGVASLNALRPWDSLLTQTERQLTGAGVPTAALDRLVRGSDAVEGLPASQLAVELSRPGRSLTVLVTDSPEEMDELFERAIRSGKLVPAGELDDARLYQGRHGDFAVRDGVMLSASTILRLRQAILVRDGDRDDQVDDRNVQELLDEVPEQAPLDVYANVAVLTDGDPAISELAAADNWLRSVRDAVFAVRGTPKALVVNAFGRLEEDRPPAEDPPLGEEPTRAVASVAGIAGAAPSSPLRELLTGAQPIRATATVDGDELRATLRLTP